jgi:transposase
MRPCMIRSYRDCRHLRLANQMIYSMGSSVVGVGVRDCMMGCPVGRIKLTGQGRPSLRLAAWRAVWGAHRANPVFAARFQHLTKRETNKLTATQAQAVIAAAILRQLHAVVTTGQRWNAEIATHGTKPAAVTPIAA